MFRRSDSVSKSKSSNPIVRLFKSIISITILSAFILVLSLFIRELSTMSSDKFANLSGALLSRVHVKIDERQVGDVAGKFVARLTDVGISSNEATKESTAPVVTTNEALFKVAILSDIHQDFTNLDKALILCKKNNVSAIFLLGDLTDFGDVASL